MAVIVALNVVLAVFVVGGILALLGWSIASDRVVAARLVERRRALLAHRRAPAQRRATGTPGHSRGPAYTRGA